MGKLDGKVAVITGAASGMGVEHARVFVEEGAKVAVTDIMEEAGQKLANELGENAIFVKLDVTSPKSWSETVKVVNDKFGPIDILVNNAGYSGPPALIENMKNEDYLKTIAIDQHGVFYGMQAVIPDMLKQGRGSIVNISSVAGFVHQKDVPNPAYTAAKFAVRGLTKAAAVTYGPKNIRVNSVHPGGVLTPMLSSTLTQEAIDAVSSDVPLRRLAEPREVSNLVLFLASDDSSYINGAEHLIDGGQTAD